MSRRAGTCHTSRAGFTALHNQRKVHSTMSAIVTLTSDFSLGSPYVAAMKASVLGVCRSVTLVDICHDVAPQDVLHGALVLGQAVFEFPPGTIHLAVVDPGVGTARRLVALAAGGHRFVGPDNGLFEQVLRRGDFEQVVELAEPRYWRPEVSATFHGRDIMGPVAGHLAAGVALEALGPSLSAADLVRLDIPQARVTPDAVEGECLYVDSFGTLVTNIPGTAVAGREAEVYVGEQRVPIVRTYGDRSRGELVALVGSSGWLEVAEVGGNAARRLASAAGTPLSVQYAKS